MLNVEKVRLMTDLARYESNEGKEDLRISRYYRRDYIGLAMFKNFLLTTIGYLLLWTAVISYNIDYLLNNIHRMNFTMAILEFIFGYIIFITVYSIITYVKRHGEYTRARKNVKAYYAKLNDLAKGYGQNDQKTKKKELAGGNHS